MTMMTMITTMTMMTMTIMNMMTKIYLPILVPAHRMAAADLSEFWADESSTSYLLTAPTAADSFSQKSTLPLICSHNACNGKVFVHCAGACVSSSYQKKFWRSCQVLILPPLLLIASHQAHFLQFV